MPMPATWKIWKRAWGLSPFKNGVSAIFTRNEMKSCHFPSFPAKSVFFRLLQEADPAVARKRRSSDAGTNCSSAAFAFVPALGPTSRRCDQHIGFCTFGAPKTDFLTGRLMINNEIISRQTHHHMSYNFIIKYCAVVLHMFCASQCFVGSSLIICCWHFSGDIRQNRDPNTYFLHLNSSPRTCDSGDTESNCT